MDSSTRSVFSGPMSSASWCSLSFDFNAGALISWTALSSSSSSEALPQGSQSASYLPIPPPMLNGTVTGKRLIPRIKPPHTPQRYVHPSESAYAHPDRSDDSMPDSRTLASAVTAVSRYVALATQYVLTAPQRVPMLA